MVGKRFKPSTETMYNQHTIATENGILRVGKPQAFCSNECFKKWKAKTPNSSPAKMERLSDHVWTWHEFMHKQLTISD
jgi:hypothetical protein